MQYPGYRSGGRFPAQSYQPPWNPYGGLSPRAYGERQGIRRVSLGLSVAFLVFFGAQFLFQMLLMGGLLIAGYSLRDMYALLMEPGFVWVQQVALSALVFTIPFLISIKVCRQRIGRVLPLGGVTPSLFVPLVMSGLGVCMLGNLATNILGQTLSAFQLVPVQPVMENPDGIFGAALVILGSAFLPALVEEFAFRGVALGLLRPYGDSFAIVISSLLFGLMHGNLVQTPFAIVVGLGLGYITVAANSMWPAIVAHFLNNLFATLLNEWMSGMSPTAYMLANNGYVLALLVVGLIGAAWLTAKRPAAFRLHPSPCALDSKGRYAAFLGHPLMIVVLALFGLTMVMVQFSF